MRVFGVFLIRDRVLFFNFPGDIIMNSGNGSNFGINYGRSVEIWSFVLSMERLVF